MPSLLKMMAEMGLNITPFQKGLQQAKQEAATQGNNIGQAFSRTINRYFGVAALTAFGASMVRRITEIKDLAEQFNLTTDEVQKFGAAFEKSGLNASDAGAAIDRLNRARREAVEGNKDLRDSFAVFGINVERLNDASVETKDIFRQIGLAIRDGQTGTEARAAMMDLLGKNGARFAAAMKDLENVSVTIIPREQVEEVENATRHLKELRRELEAIIILRASKAAKGDLTGILQDDLERIEKKTGLKPQHPALELLGLLREAFGPKEEAEFRNGRPNIRAAIKMASPPKVNAGKLFEDGILAKQRLDTGKAQKEVEEKLSEIVFGKLSKEQRISLLRRQQGDAEMEVEYQKRMLAKEVDASEERQLKRQEIMANAKKQQLDAEQKILALQRQNSGVGFQGFKELLQIGGTNPANYAPLPSRGRPQSMGGDKAIGILGEIENQLKNKKVILGR